MSVIASFFFFFNDTATTEIYTLSLHDALPIFRLEPYLRATARRHPDLALGLEALADRTLATKLALVHGDVSPKNILCGPGRSEEHTSELQSRQYLVCRLLLEKKKTQDTHIPIH